MFNRLPQPDRLWLWLVIWTGVAVAVAYWSPTASPSPEQVDLRQAPAATGNGHVGTMQPLHPGTAFPATAVTADAPLAVVPPVIAGTSVTAPESSYVEVAERSTGPPPRADARRQPPSPTRRLVLPQ